MVVMMMTIDDVIWQIEQAESKLATGMITDQRYRNIVRETLVEFEKSIRNATILVDND
jgi:hypothetical protein